MYCKLFTYYRTQICIVINRTLADSDSYIGLINFGSELIKPALTTLTTDEKTFVIYAASVNSGLRKG